MPTDHHAAAAASSGDRPRRWAFALVCLTYGTATVGEQLLSPLFPTARTDLGLTTGQGGVAFAVLAVSIAVFNMVAGLALRRWCAATVMRASLLTVAAGSTVAALATGLPSLLVSQALLGAAAGLFFPSGLQGVATFAEPGRRGFAMGIYGVAFSVGLTVAALLGTLGAATSWRIPFWSGAGLGVVSLVAIARLRTPMPDPGGARGVPWRAVFGLPTVVGTIGAMLQYGVLAFFTTFAVERWELTEGAAAAVLAVGRVVSIAAKLVGGRTTDRVGPRGSVVRTSLLLSALGLLWVLLPGGLVTYGVAAVFAGTVSSIFPAANVMAVERFGSHGLALGAYRSVQIGMGALAGFVIGNSPLSLQITVLIAVSTPLLLVWACRPLVASDPER